MRNKRRIPNRRILPERVLATLLLTLGCACMPAMRARAQQTGANSAGSGSADSSSADSSLLVPRSDQILGQAQELDGKHRKKKQKKDGQTEQHGLLLAGHRLPVAPLGFAAPAAHYLTQQISQVSLDFLDEDHLLFTFRVPGLIARPRAGGQAPAYQRHIRAVVLQISTGETVAESLWTLHDTDRYVWVLNDGRFLLRDGNLLRVGDATLRMRTFLRFPGPVERIETDPLDHYLVADTEEPSTQTAGKRPSLLSATGEVSEPPPMQHLIRIIDIATRRVMLISHTDGPIHLPLSENGFYQLQRGDGLDWMVSYAELTGHSEVYWKISSVCMPPLEPVAPGFLLATPCGDDGSRAIVMLSRGTKSVIWHKELPATSVWPVLAESAGGLRFARSTLELSEAISAGNPIDPSEIRSQKVEVFNTADGVLEFAVDADPILDAGGNVALSPTGRRVAVLRQGAIQIFDLPAPPALPTATAQSQTQSQSGTAAKH